MSFVSFVFLAGAVAVGVLVADLILGIGNCCF